MDFIGEMNYYYYRMSLGELRMLNVRDHTRGISYHSMLCLNIIAHLEQCTVSKLAEVLQITKSGVTMKVNELVGKGLVQKVRSEEDKRVYYLTLSKDIKAVYGMFDHLAEAMASMLKGKYSEKELALFTDILHTISDYDGEGLHDGT